jgi:uncharacterized protein YjbI with pentapeptide repeats
MLNHPAIIRGSMLRYIFLSGFALLLLTACGGNDLDQAVGEEPVTDTSSKDLNKVFENPTGTRVVIDKEAEDADDKTQQKTEDPTPTATPTPAPTAAPTPAPTNSVGPIPTELGIDIDKFLDQPNPKSCGQCDLRSADLRGENLDLPFPESCKFRRSCDLRKAHLFEANLSRADMYEANLSGANLSGANLDDVVGADFYGALNVPAKYLKD